MNLEKSLMFLGFEWNYSLKTEIVDSSIIAVTIPTVVLWILEVKGILSERIFKTGIIFPSCSTSSMYVESPTPKVEESETFTRKSPWEANLISLSVLEVQIPKYSFQFPFVFTEEMQSIESSLVVGNHSSLIFLKTFLQQWSRQLYVLQKLGISG